MSDQESKLNGDENLNQNSSQGNESGDSSWESKLSAAQEQADKFKNEYLYLRAEFENYKRNVIKERSELLKFGSERLAKDVIGVLDNFERALASPVNAETWQNFLQGVELTAKQLKEALNKNGIQEVPSNNVPFDPMSHEALGSEPTSDTPEGHITKTFAKAYKLHDKIIRPAQVIVARKP